MLSEQLRTLETPTEILLREVKETRTLDGGVSLYQNAGVGLYEVDPNDLYPTALYTLSPNKQRLRELQTVMDIFNLQGIEQTPNSVIAPPIVEVSDGVLAIVDGIHRCSLAKEQQQRLTVVIVDGASIPIISYPVKWDQVTEYPTKPERPEQLRIMRVDDTDGTIRQYYRNFSHLGSTGRRKRNDQ